MKNNLDLSCEDSSDPDAEDLSAILRHFWGSAYWSDLLRKSKHIDEKTKEYLLAKSRQFDVLQEKLIRLENECHIEPLTDEQIEQLRTQRDELLDALKLALRQNEHDMVMTGDECRQCRAAITKAEGGK